MQKLTTLALGAALSLAALPALAQTSGSGTESSPGTSTSNPNASATTPNSGNGSTTTTTDQAPPAGSGTRALTPGQNPDGTPRAQSPGNAPQLPGMKGQN